MQAFIKIFLLASCLIQTVYAGKEVTFSLLSLDQATKKIIEENKSKVLSAKTELIDGKTIHIIKILTSDGRVQFIKVDADSGKMIK